MLSIESSAAERNNSGEDLAAEPPRSREWWAEESIRTGTDWATIIKQRQDALRVMATECPSCGRTPCPTPSFCGVCRDADQKAGGRKLPDHIPDNWNDETVSLEALWSRFNERRRGTPQGTIEAILYCVHARGVAALREPANIERLSRCDERARTEIDQRINKKLAGGDDA